MKRAGIVDGRPAQGAYAREREKTGSLGLAIQHAIARGMAACDGLRGKLENGDDAARVEPARSERRVERVETRLGYEFANEAGGRGNGLQC